ncbi:MAG: corrinoid protein [bacterium]
MKAELTRLGDALLAGNVEEVRRLTQEALRLGVPPQAILDTGMRPAMERLGERFSAGLAYLPELLLAADTMKEGMEVLRPAVLRGEVRPEATLLIGTVEGDIHDIGKNLVRMMFEGGGFRVIDLGIDVTCEGFVEAYRREQPDLVGLSALLTTTIGQMEKVIRLIRAEDPRARVLVGGAPVRQAFADRIGASGYAPDAAAAVKVGRSLLGLG